MTESSAAPRRGPAYGFGLLAALGVAAAYATLAEILGLTFGLVAVGFFGGWIIGNAVTWGAWRGEEHAEDEQLKLPALVIAIVGWLLGVVLAYVVSQAILPEATTSLIERLTPGRFLEYFLGLDSFILIVHLLSLVALAFMAWRSAR